jgi:hypothetical protein
MTDPYGNPIPAGNPMPSVPQHQEPVDAPSAAFIAGPHPPYGGQPGSYAQSPASPAAPAASGAPYQYPALGNFAAVNQNYKTNGMAITALILGITGFLFIPACIGMGLGFGALGTIKHTGQPGKGMAVAGIVLSSAWLVLWVLLVVLS